MVRATATSQSPRDAPQSADAGGHPRRFLDPRTGVSQVRLMPGEYYATAAGELLTTVLGSCIGVCAWDPGLRVGGMNHFMLPAPETRGDRWQGTLADPGARYGTVAMERLVNSLLRLGARRERLELKVFGGGRVIAGMGDVGALNIAFLRAYVRTEGLRVVAMDVGGDQARRVEFSPAAGRVRVRRLRPTAQVAVAERRYRAALPAGEGQVELFEP